MKGVKFVENGEKIEENLDTTTEALEELQTEDFETLTTDQLVKLVKLLVELCRQNNNQIQSDISLIAQLDKDCFELLAAHEN